MRRNLAEGVRPDKDDEDKRPIGKNLVLVEVAVEAVPAALGRVAATVAVVVRVVVTTVRVIDWVAGIHRTLAVPSVKEALLAVAGTIACTVAEQVIAADALSYRRAVLV